MTDPFTKSQSLDEFSPAEARAIEAHKYYLSLEAGHDVGMAHAISDWVRHYSGPWRQARLQEELDAQRSEIQRHKWIESERAGQDLGQRAVQDWIARFAAEWRRWREQQDCQS